MSVRVTVTLTGFDVPERVAQVWAALREAQAEGVITVEGSQV